MDILNWLYLKTQGLVRTQVNDAKTDLVALGTEVPFIQRGDGYQTYSMTLADAVHAGCTENNTLRTGIYDSYPFAIGVPVMLKTCTQVIDTPAFPTFLAINLQGWKVAGSVSIINNASNDVIYLGTVQNASFFSGFPWKVSGSVYTYDDSNGTNIYSALANGAKLFDLNNNVVVNTDIYITVDYFGPDAFDIYLVYDQTDPSAELDGIISFEFEFLNDASVEPTFTVY